MQKLTFTKSGIIASFWDSESENWQERPLLESALPISWFLPYETFVEEDVTLNDILTHITEYHLHLDLIFVNYLKGIPVETLIDNLKNARPWDERVKVDAMCLLWFASSKSIEGEEDPQLDTYPTLMGLEMSEDEDLDEDEFHSMHEVTITQMMNSPFILDDLIEFFEAEDPEEILLSGVTSWTLFDFLRSIFGELVVYSLTCGIFQRVEGDVEPPISSTELFEHLDDLDKFFKTN